MNTHICMYLTACYILLWVVRIVFLTTTYGSNIFMYIIRAAKHEQTRISYTWMFVYIATAVKYSLKLIGFVVFSCNSLIQALVGKSRALSLFPFVVYCTCCGWAIHTKTVHVYLLAIHGFCFNVCVVLRACVTLLVLLTTRPPYYMWRIYVCELNKI